MGAVGGARGGVGVVGRGGGAGGGTMVGHDVGENVENCVGGLTAKFALWRCMFLTAIFAFSERG